ncbi:putative non-LTR retroelement reverse transcriptase related protein, partial [Trifolium medium]|nr:putative non-LTR retroelement reverse transcriptase related protein [Trifolium medium]
TDPWVDETPLCERFGRLFDLAENKSVSVAVMFSLGWRAGREAWVWRRQLRGVGGGYVGGVSDLTSSSLLAGSVFR